MASRNPLKAFQWDVAQSELCIKTNLSKACGAFQVTLVIKNSPVNAGPAGDAGLIPVIGKILWRRIWQPTTLFLLG